MISLYYPLIQRVYSMYRYFLVRLLLFFFVFLARSIPHALVYPMFFFSRALSRISSYRMISIHGFTFGSRYLYSTGGVTVTTRTAYLICTVRSCHISQCHAPPAPITKSDTAIIYTCSE
jgi:hypothetical protein